MTELERALLALGEAIDFPPEPDLRPRVRERIQGRRLARPLVLAFAAVVVAVGVAFAVPPARSAILRFFHIGSFGLWISGGKHVIYWQTDGRTRRVEPRLAGNVLIWTQDGRTFRLEGNLREDQMLELARDITR